MGEPRLTFQQLRALALIAESIERRGVGPSLREVADGLGLSAKSAASHHVTELERHGWVTVERTGESGRAATRTVRVTEAGHRLLTRWEQFQASGKLHRELDLVMNPTDWETAKRMNTSLMICQVRTVRENVVLTFKNAKERHEWVLLFLSRGELQ